MSCPDVLDFSISILSILSFQYRLIGQNSDRDISNFLIYDQFLINENLHNSRIDNYIDMKLRPATKLDKNVKSFDCDIMLANSCVIVVYWIYQQFGAIRKLASVCMVCNTYIFINRKLLSYKIWKQNWKISNATLILFVGLKVLFLPKNVHFFPKKCWHHQN